MKLLFDQNLSPSLAKRLTDLFPGSAHVQECGLDQADDREVWEFAAAGQYVIITKDNDFNELSQLLGPPPHVIWIRHGNCSTREMEKLIRQSYHFIHDWESTSSSGLMIIV